MDRKHSLHTYVHRALVFRLTAVGLTLSLLIGLAAFFIERDRVSQEAINMAVDRLSVFSSQYDYLLSNPDNLEEEKIHQAINDFRAAQRRSTLGSFVFLGVYSVHGKIVTEIFDRQQGNLIEEKIKHQGMEIKPSGLDNEQYEIIRIAGSPYLRISLPLINSSRQTAGIINGLFAFNPEAIRSFRFHGIWAMIGTIAIVLLTTIILYPVILRLTGRITRYSVKLLEANLDTLETLGNAIAQRDSDTNVHNYRVSIYASHIGEELNLPDQTMRTLIKGSFLHDAGEIGIPDEILLKNGKLDEKKFEIMKTHVEQGRDIIQRSEWLQDALEVVLSHHEKMAGKGYPGRLEGGSIPVTASIFAAADVFDALTSKHPYKEAFSF